MRGNLHRIMKRTIVVGAGAGSLYGLVSYVPLALFIVLNQPALSGVLIALAIGIGVALVGSVLGGTYGLVAGVAGGFAAARTVDAGGSSRRAQVSGTTAVAAMLLIPGGVLFTLFEDLEEMITVGLWLVGIPAVLATVATYAVIGHVLDGESLPAGDGGASDALNPVPVDHDSAATSDEKATP